MIYRVTFDILKNWCNTFYKIESLLSLSWTRSKTTFQLYYFGNYYFRLTIWKETTRSSLKINQSSSPKAWHSEKLKYFYSRMVTIILSSKNFDKKIYGTERKAYGEDNVIMIAFFVQKFTSTCSVKSSEHTVSKNISLRKTILWRTKRQIVPFLQFS